MSVLTPTPDESDNAKNAHAPCPDCGRCPTCGRRDAAPYVPYVPTYPPVWPYRPWWVGGPWYGTGTGGNMTTTTWVYYAT